MTTDTGTVRTPLGTVVRSAEHGSAENGESARGDHAVSCDRFLAVGGDAVGRAGSAAIAGSFVRSAGAAAAPLCTAAFVPKAAGTALIAPIAAGLEPWAPGTTTPRPQAGQVTWLPGLRGAIAIVWLQCSHWSVIVMFVSAVGAAGQHSTKLVGAKAHDHAASANNLSMDATACLTTYAPASE